MTIRFLYRLKRPLTPIQIRHTIGRAKACHDSSAILGQLIWPLPWYFSLPESLSPEELRASPDLIDVRQSGIRHLYEIPLFRMRDTSLRSLYRLYDDMCASDLDMMIYESEYFFSQGSRRWLLSQIPDPQDSDSVRYAILASLLEALVASFNWKLELGIRRGRRPCDQSEERSYNFVREEAPLWVTHVAMVDKPINLINRDKEPVAKPDELFLKRNIVAMTGYLYTV
jgi:hypothetical protein